MKIIFDPCQSKSNEYVNIITQQLANQNVFSYPLNSTLKNFTLLKQIDAVHLNWFENISATSSFNRLFGFIKKIITLLILILFRKPIFWTLHNKQPHDQKNQAYSKLLMYALAHTSRVIFIHSKDSENLLEQYYGSNIKKKAHYIPHPHYIGAYPTLDVVTSTESAPLNLLFIGAVKPYKNIELLIKAIKQLNHQNVHLTIAGKPASEQYKQSLLRHNIPNLNLQLSFIEDTAMIQLIEACDALVLPYNIQSSLNSGTVFLAFSYKKTVICPKIGTMNDYPNNANILVYDYQNADEHLSNLITFLEKGVQLKKENPNIFKEMGQKMYEEVHLNNDPKKIATQLIEIYKS